MGKDLKVIINLTHEFGEKDVKSYISHKCMVNLGNGVKNIE